VNTDPPLKICLLRLSAIGDTCNVVPTVQQLQEAFPNSTITWIIGAVEHRLLGALPGVEFITVDKSSKKKALRALYADLSTQHYDVLLNMHASMRANLLSRHIRATRKIGFDRARARDFQSWFCNEFIEACEKPHVVEGFLQFARHLGVAEAPPVWRLPVNAEADAYARKVLSSDGDQHKKSMVISPCSSDRRRNFRNWSVDNYVRLAQYADEEFGLNVVLTKCGGVSGLRSGAHGQCRGDSGYQLVCYFEPVTHWPLPEPAFRSRSLSGSLKKIHEQDY